MLTKEDLQAIRGIVRDEVTVIVDSRIESLMEHQLMPQFELIHREFDRVHKEIAWIKNAMVTKSFLEERLERFRIDLGLSYRAVG